MSPADEVRKKGRQFGFSALSDAQVEHIIWAQTGYPGFWPRRHKTPLQNFQKQVYDFFATARRHGLAAALADERWELRR